MLQLHAMAPYNRANKYISLDLLSELSGVPKASINVEQYRIAGVMPFYTSSYRAASRDNDDRVLVEIGKAFSGKKHKVFPYSADNELLEFHGDALLRLILAEYLLATYPGKTEAFYTRVRINCEKKTSLAKFARERGIAGEYAIVSKEYEFRRNSMHTIEDIFEAFVSGLYYAFGMSVARFFVVETLKNTSMDIIEDTNYKNQIIAAGSISKNTSGTYSMPTAIALELSGGKYREGTVVYDRRTGKCIGASVAGSSKKATEAATRQALAYFMALKDGEPKKDEMVLKYDVIAAKYM